MKFRCNAAPKAVPCVSIETTNTMGKLLKKPKRHYKCVRNGEILQAVPDRCSRKHFTAVDAEAEKRNDADYKTMLDECKKLGIKVPPGTPFSVLADSLAKIEYDKNQKEAAKIPELLTVPDRAVVLAEPIVNPVKVEDPVVELTNAQLKAKIEDLGGEYPQVVNKAKLKEILNELEPDKDK